MPQPPTVEGISVFEDVIELPYPADISREIVLSSLASERVVKVMIAHQQHRLGMEGNVGIIFAELPVIHRRPCTMSRVKIVVLTARVVKHRSMRQYLEGFPVITENLHTQYQGVQQHTLAMPEGVYGTVRHIEPHTAIHKSGPLPEHIPDNGLEIIYFVFGNYHILQLVVCMTYT